MNEPNKTVTGIPRPGDDVIVLTAGSCGVTCHDWFFCTRKIDKEKALAAIKK